MSISFKFQNRGKSTFLHMLADSYEEKKEEYNLDDLVLSKNINVNSPDDNWMTPLHLAAYNHNESAINFLLKFNADVHCKDWTQSTPLHLACQTKSRSIEKHEKIIRLLVANGADVNAKNYFGQTPLFIACKENIVASYILLQLGADVNEIDNSGNTVFFMINAFFFECCQDLWLGRTIFNIFRNHVHALKLLNNSKKTFINENTYSIFLELEMKFYPLSSIDFFYNQCHDELSLMSNIRLDNYSSLYELIFKHKNEMPAYINNEIYQNILRSSDIIEKFQFYGFLLRLKYKEGVKRRALLNSAKTVIPFLTINLPDYCVENILLYLTDEELKGLVNNFNLFDNVFL